LNKNVQALLHRKRGVEYYEAEAQGQNIVTGANLQEVANGTLFDAALVKIWMQAGHPPRTGEVCNSGTPFDHTA